MNQQHEPSAALVEANAALQGAQHFDELRGIARQFTDQMFGQAKFADALVGMIVEVDRICTEQGDSELVREASILTVVEAFAKRWRERSDQ